MDVWMYSCSFLAAICMPHSDKPEKQEIQYVCVFYWCLTEYSDTAPDLFIESCPMSIVL